MISPDPPRILQGDFIAVTEGQEIDIECVSENGKPAAEVRNEKQHGCSSFVCDFLF